MLAEKFGENHLETYWKVEARVPAIYKTDFFATTVNNF